MKQASLTTLALLVFALILASFIVRGFGQFVVGPRTATLLAGPVAIAAAAVALFVIGIWAAARVGITSIERDPEDR